MVGRTLKRRRGGRAPAKAQADERRPRARSRRPRRPGAVDALPIDPLELDDRLRPRPARRRSRPGGSLLNARQRRAPPDRRRARHGHPDRCASTTRSASARTSTSLKVRGTEVARGQSSPATSSRWTRATRSASSAASRRPSRRSACRRCGSPTAARRGRGARLHGRRRRVGDRHPPHRDDPPPTSPSCSPARTSSALLDGLKEVNAAVVEEVVPDLLSVGEIQRVLQALLREGVSIRDLGTIVEASATRPASPATRRCWPSTRARRSAARSSRRTSTPSSRLRASRWIRRSSRRSPTRSPPRPTASTSRWTRSARRTCVSGALRAVRAGALARAPAGAAVLLARAPPSAPPVRAGAPAACGLRLQRDPARRGGRDDGRGVPRRAAGRRLNAGRRSRGRRPRDDPARRAPVVPPEGAPRWGRRLRGRLRRAG